MLFNPQEISIEPSTIASLQPRLKKNIQSS